MVVYKSRNFVQVARHRLEKLTDNEMVCWLTEYTIRKFNHKNVLHFYFRKTNSMQRTDAGHWELVRRERNPRREPPHATQYRCWLKRVEE